MKIDKIIWQHILVEKHSTSRHLFVFGTKIVTFPVLAKLVTAAVCRHAARDRPRDRGWV